MNKQTPSSSTSSSIFVKNYSNGRALRSNQKKADSHKDTFAEPEPCEDDLEFGQDDTIKAPTPFRRFEGFDSYDFKDIHSPSDLSLDKYSIQFTKFSRDIVTEPNLNFTLLAQRMTPITPDGGVKKRILLESSFAEGESLVEDGNRVWVHYELYAENKSETGSCFIPLDSTKKHNLAASLHVGMDGLPGITLALKTMKKKEIAEFLFEPLYAYGKLGIPKFIEPDTRVWYIVQLEDVSKKCTGAVEFMTPLDEDFGKMDFSDVLTAVGKLIKAGNEKFKDEYFREAADRYRWGLSLIDDYITGDYHMDRNLVLKRYHLFANLALCHIRRKEYKDALEACKMAGRLDFHDHDIRPKILYRQAVANFHLRNFKEVMRLCEGGLRCCWGKTQFRDLKVIAHNAIQRLKILRERKQMDSRKPGSEGDAGEGQNRPQGVTRN